MEFLSDLEPTEIWERLDKRAYHWDRKEERLAHWNDYGFFYKKLSGNTFKIVYTRGHGYYDAMIVAIQEQSSGSLLIARTPWFHKNSEQNDAVDIIKIHLLKRYDSLR